MNLYSSITLGYSSFQTTRVKIVSKVVFLLQSFAKFCIALNSVTPDSLSKCSNSDTMCIIRLQSL